MVLAALLIMLTIGLLMVVLFKNEFMSWYGKSIEVDEGHYAAYEYLRGEGEQKLAVGEWSSLADDLKKYGYELYVRDESENEQYSDMRYANIEAIEPVNLKDRQCGELVTMLVGGVSVIAGRYEAGGNVYEVYTAKSTSNTIFPGIELGMFETFIIFFLVVGFVSVAGILLCSRMFTSRLVSRIMKPVDALGLAAKRVSEGNLDIPVSYSDEDEFKSLCDSFNMMQENLKAELEQNKAYEVARTELVSGISHDIRTPLTAVKGYIKGVLDGVASTEEKRTEYLTIAYKRSCDMDVLLSKLLYFSKLETGNMPFYKQKTDMMRYIADYVDEKRTELQHKNIGIEFSADSDSEAVCFVDREQLRRVFDNIIDNSIKYSGKGENLIVGAKLGDEGENIVIDFYDNGCGIDENKVSHVFEQFYRGDESRKSEGNGLGLYICKYIIREHDGLIAAYNKDGFHIAITLGKYREVT